MKVFSVAFSLMLAQSVVAQNYTDDYVDDLYNATTTYAPTSASAGVTVTVDTPSPTPSGGDDDWSTYAPTSADGDDYASYEPTAGSDDAFVGTPAPSAGSDDAVVGTPAPSAVGGNSTDDYQEPAVSTPAPSAIGTDDDGVSTPAPSAAGTDGSDDAYVGTPAPSAGSFGGNSTDDYQESDDESDVTVEEIDDAISMDYSSTIAAVETMNSSAAVRGAATLVLGFGCMAYYLF